MGNVLQSLYREEAQAWRERYRKYFKYAARALGLGFVSGFLFFMLWPAQEKRALALVFQALKDIPLDAGPVLMALTLFYHNARASAVTLAAGVVPFVFVPILDPVINGGVLGLLVSAGQHQGLNVPKLVLTQILPHGVVELTAVLYTTSLGLYLSAELGRKAKSAWQERRARKGRIPWRRPLSGPSEQPGAGADGAPAESKVSTSPEGGPASGPGLAPPCQPGLVRDLVRSFALVVLPLLFVAALIEAFITPHLR
jgi:uncharacterized membrane protein SpoIIM required for sporulation